MIDGYVMSDETLRTHMHLMHTLLDIIELCLSDHSGLAKTVVGQHCDDGGGDAGERGSAVKQESPPIEFCVDLRAAGVRLDSCLCARADSRAEISTPVRVWFLGIHHRT